MIVDHAPNYHLSEPEVRLLACARVFATVARDYANRTSDAGNGKLLDQLIILGDRLQLVARQLLDPHVTAAFQPTAPPPPASSEGG